jgi:hypothetical protein
MTGAVLILGSGPDAVAARNWPREPFDRIVAINNAWAVRPDWDDLIHPWDFPADRLPDIPTGHIVTEAEFVPAQNAYGGFVYAGATMAFTAGYWVLAHYRPKVMAFAGCNMHYPAEGPTHFYGQGEPDPLRPDITLQSLEAKSARLMVFAAMQGCATVNLTPGGRRRAGRGAGLHQLALACVARQRRGTLELDTRLACASELDQEIAAHRRQQMVITQARFRAQRFDHRQSGSRPIGHADRDRPIELDHRRRRHLRQPCVQRRDA